MSDVKKKLIDYILENKEYQNTDGSLNKYKFINDVEEIKPSLVSYLASIKDKKMFSLVFSKIADMTVLNQSILIKIVNSKEYVKNSTTFYQNKIGLVNNGSNVVLDFPFKDCVLLGGMDKEDEKNKTEVFYHELLDKDKIDNLFSPKVFTNVERYGNSDDSNLVIKGNNLIGLHTLSDKYKGIIDVIYIDPPYFFIDKKPADTFDYNSNFKLSSWLTFMKNRLETAKTIMSEKGVLFVSISKEGSHYLKIMLDELFGGDSFLGEIIQDKGNAQNDAKNIQTNHEYIFCYSKQSDGRFFDLLTTKTIFENKIFSDSYGVFYKGAGLVMGGGVGGTINGRPFLGYTIYYNPDTGDFLGVQDQDIEKARVSNVESEVYKDNEDLIKKGYIKIRPSKNGKKLGVWKKGLDNFNNEKYKINISKTKDGYSVSQKKYLNEIEYQTIKKNGEEYAIFSKETNSKSIIKFSGNQGTNSLKKLFNDKVFDNPKNLDMIKYLINLSTLKNPMVLDFFAGSGTTGHAVLDLNKEDGGNRKFILLEQMDYAKDLTAERIKRVIEQEKLDESFTYCELLKDSIKEDIKKCKKDSELIKLVDSKFHEGYFQYIDSKEELLKILKEQKDIKVMKKILIENYLDHNREYIPYSDIKSVKLDKKDLEFNKKFYGEDDE